MLIIRKDMATDMRVCEKELQNNLCGAKGNLCEVTKREVDLDHWIQKDTWRRSTYFRGKVL
jgi:hypothetical protein